MFSARCIRGSQVLRGENRNRHPDVGDLWRIWDLDADRPDPYHSRILQRQGGPACVPVDRTRFPVEWQRTLSGEGPPRTQIPELLAFAGSFREAFTQEKLSDSYWFQILFVQQPISNQAACLRFVRLVRSDLFWSLQLSVSAFFRHAVASQIRSTGSPVKRQMAYASGSRNDRRLLKTLASKYSQPEHPHLINRCS